jgi:protein phosphatase
VEVAVGTDLGIWQRRQSDAHVAECIAPGVSLLAVADGFGDVGRGSATASLALATVREYLRRRHRVGSFGRNVSPSSLRAVLLAALDYANARLFAQSGSHEDFVGSGTSITTVLIVGAHAFVGHVGDARAYLMRLDRLELLTADDAMFADAAVTSAKTSLPAKPRTRGLLWRSLGTQAKLEASIAHVEIVPGDQLVLCTDGVHRTVEDDELSGALLDCESASDVVARLLATAKSRGAVDNATLVVGRDLLAPAAPIAGMAGAVGPLRAGVALVVIVATLLLSYGAYALRGGTVIDHQSTTNSDAR